MAVESPSAEVVGSQSVEVVGSLSVEVAGRPSAESKSRPVAVGIRFAGTASPAGIAVVAVAGGTVAVATGSLAPPVAQSSRKSQSSLSVSSRAWALFEDGWA